MSTPQPHPLDQSPPAGFRWPEFSPGFRKQWNTTIRQLLRGNTGSKVLTPIYYPDGFRREVHFWNEMRFCAAMAKTYADLGGDAVKGLANALLVAADGEPSDSPESDALHRALDAPEVLALALAGVADMRARLGTEPSAWAKERLQASGASSEQIAELAGKPTYANWPVAPAP